jgi:hypothetical protein
VRRTRDAALESRLRDQVAKSYDEHLIDANVGIPADEVMARLRAS